MSEDKKPTEAQETEPAAAELTDQDLSDVAGGKPQALYGITPTVDC